jgi:hypothetical protein
MENPAPPEAVAGFSKLLRKKVRGLVPAAAISAVPAIATATATATAAAIVAPSAATTAAISAPTATATAAISAAATTTISAATTTAAVAAAATLFAWSSFIDRQRPAVDRLPVKLGDGVLSFLVGAHGDKGEAA